MTKYDAIRYDLENISNIITSYFDINKDDLFKSNKEEIVEARYCLIYILCSKYKDVDIAKVTGLSKSVVNKIRNIVGRNNKNRSFYIELNNIKALCI